MLHVKEGYVVNRYAMYRDEYGFEVDVDAESLMDEVKTYVEEVIFMAKHILEEKYNKECYIEGHDDGAAYWIYPVKVEVVQESGKCISEIREEYLDKEISVDGEIFNRYFKKLFINHIDKTSHENMYRFTRAYRDEGEYIDGFDDTLEPNFYTAEQIRQIADEIGKTHKGFGKLAQRLIIMSQECDKNIFILVMGP